MYPLILKLLIRHFDPETAHGLAKLWLRAGMGSFIRSGFSDALVTEAMGLKFATPFGVAAGFDKGAEMVAPLRGIGFGHVEIGTVTYHPQPGNDRPRLFRLYEDRALINRMGFNNPGAKQVRERLLRLRESGRRLPIIGVNIGKSRICPLEEAAEDYAKSLELLGQLADYLVINVSSPNTPGLRQLQKTEHLQQILQAFVTDKPVLVKIAPDLTDEQILEAADLVKDQALAGMIAVNTTISRPELRSPKAAETGGLSGPMLRERAQQAIALLRSRLPKEKFCVISVGGVDTAAEVIKRLELGADLVQGYTGFIYHGPGWAGRINRELAISQLRTSAA